MKFKKLRIEGVPGKKEPRENWYLVIDNAEDLVKYLDLDAGMYAQALLSMRRVSEKGIESIQTDHLSSNRESALGTMINIKVAAAPEGARVWPHEVLSELIGKKASTMLRMVNSGNAIQINESGGYCDEAGFHETWNPVIIDTIERDNCAFPIDSDPISAEYLIIENGTSVPESFINDVKKHWGVVNSTEIRKIVELKEKDIRWIAKSVALSKRIAFQTNALDQHQINEFMTLFEKLPSKEVFISTTNKETITSHPLFFINSMRHTITFSEK